MRRTFGVVLAFLIATTAVGASELRDSSFHKQFNTPKKHDDALGALIFAHCGKDDAGLSGCQSVYSLGGTVWAYAQADHVVTDIAARFDADPKGREAAASFVFDAMRVFSPKASITERSLAWKKLLDESKAESHADLRFYEVKYSISRLKAGAVEVFVEN